VQLARRLVAPGQPATLAAHSHLARRERPRVDDEAPIGFPGHWLQPHVGAGVASRGDVLGDVGPPAKAQRERQAVPGEQQPLVACDLRAIGTSQRDQALLQRALAGEVGAHGAGVRGRHAGEIVTLVERGAVQRGEQRGVAASGEELRWRRRPQPLLRSGMRARSAAGSVASESGATGVRAQSSISSARRVRRPGGHCADLSARRAGAGGTARRGWPLPTGGAGAPSRRKVPSRPRVHRPEPSPGRGCPQWRECSSVPRVTALWRSVRRRMPGCPVSSPAGGEAAASMRRAVGGGLLAAEQHDVGMADWGTSRRGFTHWAAAGATGDQATGLRRVRPADHLRQARPAHRDLRHHQRGDRRRPGEREEPPGGGPRSLGSFRTTGWRPELPG
jgi:hypothetical protein